MTPYFAKMTHRVLGRTWLVVSLFVLSACTAMASTPDKASVEVSDQTVQNQQVVVAKVTAVQDGFVVLHRSNAQGDGPLVPQSIGHTRISAGMTENITVLLTESVAAGEKLWAMLHVDSNNNGIYEFGPGSTDVDTPVTQDGQVVVTPFTATTVQGVTQAPALPGAQAISARDRVYTADQSSNTVSVINPATNEVLGTISLGEARLDGVLGPVDDNQVNVHGLGFSRDGRFIDAVSVSSNAAQVVDAATNEIVQTTYVGRSPHEGFISPDGTELWVAVRGENYVAVVSRATGAVTDRVETAKGTSKVVFSPDGALAFVNHLFTNELDVVDVATHKVVKRIPIPEAAGGSADEAASPDGAEVWLGHPGTGMTTVINAKTLEVKASFETGPRTNHPNFVSTPDGAFAYVTVGGLNHTKVFRRAASYQGQPELVDTIENSGVAPHGVWPSPDNTRVYVALQKSDAVDVIDVSKVQDGTDGNEVIATLRVGQDPQALIYVAGAVPAGEAGVANLTRQGLSLRIENFPVEVRGGSGASALASVRDLGDVDEVDVTASGLPPQASFTVYASDGQQTEALMNVTSDAKGGVPEALAFVQFFENYDRVMLLPKGQQP